MCWPAGRLTVEDAYAYAKFARVAAGTNDIDSGPARTAPRSWTSSPRTSSATGPERLSYTRLEAAPAVLCVALEPEEEAPVVFLRLRKAAQKHRQKVFHLGQWTTPAVLRTAVELGSSEPAARDGLIRAVPGAEAAVLTELADVAPHVVEALTGGGVILVGERAAEVPGLFTAVARLAERTGAVIGWVPRRAGERGAVEAGALPTLLPGGRPVTDDAARAEVEQAWGLPPGRCRPRPAAPPPRCSRPPRRASWRPWSSAGSTRTTSPDPAAALEALRNVGFLVSLELHTSAVTELADVVLPVAPDAQRSGSYLNWEGRRAGFGPALDASGVLPDCRVLDTLAVEMDVDLFTQTPAAAAERAGAARPARRRRATRPVGRARRAAAAGVLRPGGAGDVAPAARRVVAGRRRARTGRHGPAGAAALQPRHGPAPGPDGGRTGDGAHRARHDHAAGGDRGPAGRRGVAAGELPGLAGAGHARGRARRSRGGVGVNLARAVSSSSPRARPGRA